MSLRITIAGAVTLLITSTAYTHHSDAGLDLELSVTIEGTVTAFHWRNPHIYFTLEAAGEENNPVEWSVQMTSVAALTRRGWSSDTLVAGDRVRVETYPAINGRPYGKFRSIARLDGSAVVASSATTTDQPADSDAAATTLAGNWISDAATIERYPSRMDGMFRRQATLTEQGLAAQAAYVENSDANPQVRCLTRPAPAMILYTDLYPLQIELDDAAQTVTMRSGYFDAERVVYLDGRGHLEEARLYEGHAIGHWQGDTLVVDSRHYADYFSPQSGIPFGAQKHLVERYRLTEDGRRMSVEFTLEDPEYLSEPITQARELHYAPHAETPAFDCDPNSTTGFVAGEQMVD